MAIVGEKRGLFPELKRWVTEGRPVSVVTLPYEMSR